MLRLAADDVAGTFEKRWITPAQKLDRMNNRCERIAQLVAEHRQEFVLTAVRCCQLFSLLFRAPLGLVALRSSGTKKKTCRCGHCDENLQVYESLFRSHAGERPVAEMRAPDCDGVRQRSGDGGAGRTKSQGCPDEKWEDAVGADRHAQHAHEDHTAGDQQRGQEEYRLA